MDKTEWNERMFETMLKLACEDSQEHELYVMQAEAAENPIMPSKAFDKRMEKLFRKHTERIRFKKTIKVLGRVVAVFLIIMGSMFSVLISAQAVREQVFRTVTEWGDVFIGLHFEETQSNDDVGDDLIKPTYIPSGFLIYQEYAIDNMTSFEYINAEGCVIHYDIIEKDSGFVKQFDSEHSTQAIETIEGFSVRIFDATDFGNNYTSFIVWETADELYMISGSYKVGDLRKMAKSIIVQISQK